MWKFSSSQHYIYWLLNNHTKHVSTRFHTPGVPLRLPQATRPNHGTLPSSLPVLRPHVSSLGRHTTGGYSSEYMLPCMNTNSRGAELGKTDAAFIHFLLATMLPFLYGLFQ